MLTQAIKGLRAPLTARLIVPARGSLSEWATEHGVPWLVAPSGGREVIRGRLATYRNAVEIARLARGSALLHAEAVTCFPPVALAARWLRIPSICHVQFPPVTGELAWGLRYGAGVVVTVYQRQASEIRAEVPPRIPVLAIPNGIEVDHYVASGMTPQARALREDASHVAAIVGHVSEVKGYPVFLQAAALVLRELPRALFLCAGGETVGVGYTEQMRLLSQQLGVSSRVRFLGAVKDVRTVLGAADLFVLPSEQEGLPLAALEAMSCSRAVVATPVNGVPEAVIDGITGVLVPPRDPERLASVILGLFSDETRRSAMGLAGVRHAREHFDVTRVQEELNRLYRALASRRRGADIKGA